MIIIVTAVFTRATQNKFLYNNFKENNLSNAKHILVIKNVFFNIGISLIKNSITLKYLSNDNNFVSFFSNRF